MKNFLKYSLMAIYLVAALPALSYAQSTGSTGAVIATMAFVPSSGTVNLNASNEFTVGINVTIGTGNESAGADAVVQFSTTDLEFISAEKTTTGNPTGFYGNNGLFTNTPAATANSTGVVEIGRTADPGSYATGTGTMATLKFKSKVPAGSVVTLNFGFTAGATTDSNVAGNEGGVDLLASVTNATLTIAEGTVVGMTITSLNPNHGLKTLSQNVTITGTGFGATQGTNGKVYLGADLVTVVSWSDTSIVITVPAKSDITQDTTYPVRVVRDDAQEATFTGYTYQVLDKSGPEMFMYFGLAMSASGMAGLSYLKLFGKKKEDEVTGEELISPDHTLAN